MPFVLLTNEELDIIEKALDSHMYWQLSDLQYRRDAFVMDPGTDDPEKKPEFDKARELEARLERKQYGDVKKALKLAKAIVDDLEAGKNYNDPEKQDYAEVKLLKIIEKLEKADGHAL